ncbi:hypothetical protein CEP51_013830 [Fusarium floridanum]|uniref:Heterokaryon incompatibility domain-containing protein n=1 Tax=Fusarium floridanum TaxID=1325733 RepID=A0A428Q3Z7_9HYPO|nr:hypothetical protein CEP51_013830 [Fusarium floridanum]
MAEDKGRSEEAQTAATSNKSFEYPPKLKSGEYLPEEYYPEVQDETELLALKDALSKGFDPNTIWLEEDVLEIFEVRDDESASNDRMDWKCWNTPLHRSLRCFDFESARLLVQHGADVDLLNSEGTTALQEAIERQNEKAVQFLVEHGADLGKDEEGDKAPWHMALASGNMNIFRLLVENGAGLSTASHFEWSIVDLAILAQDQMALDILLLHDPELKPSPLLSSKSRDGTEASPAAARDLLAVATSAKFLPPRELYGVYSQVVSSMNDNPQADGMSFVDSVNHALYDAAGITRPTKRETLCDRCLSFQSHVSGCRLHAKEVIPSPPFQIHESRDALNESAKSCRLCGLAADVLDNAEKEKSQEISEEMEKLGLSGEASDGSHIYFTLLDRLQEADLLVWDPKAGLGGSLGGDSLSERFVFDYLENPGKDTTTGSPQAIKVAREWLHQCRNAPGHSLCQQSYQREDSNKTLPIRVLNLTKESCDPYLIDGKAMEGPYCALSYCWGDLGNTNTITTKANISQYRQGIPMDTLPTFIQEAIQTARSLGYQYLWIDALCIIQDDGLDWDREASKMSDVYSNADLTISSLVAKDCHDNMFQPRMLRVAQPVPFDYWLPKTQRPEWKQGVIHQQAWFPFWTLSKESTPGGFSVLGSVTVDGPISSRGWTLQEQLLSTRVLYFGPSYLYWECLCAMSVDADPSTSIMSRFAGEFASFEVNRRAHPKCTVKGLPSPAKENELPESPHTVWQALLKEFTSRNLSKASDRIPAVLALGKSLEKSIGCEFVGGMWKGDRLLESLCWKVKKRDTQQRRGPSWSWSSVGVQVNFGVFDREPFHEPVPMAAVVSFDVKANQSQSHVSGSITLKGTLHKKRVLLPHTQHDTFGEVFDLEGEVAETYYAFDLVAYEKGPLYEWAGQSMWFDEGGRPPTIIRLLLEPVDQDDNSRVFRRVGICIDDGDDKQRLDDLRAPRKDEGPPTGAWEDIESSETDQVITVV